MDEDLMMIESHLAGNEHAADVLREKYTKQIRQVMTQPFVELCRKLVDEAFDEAFKHLAELNTHKCSFKQFVAMIATNRFVRQYK